MARINISAICLRSNGPELCDCSSAAKQTNQRLDVSVHSQYRVGTETNLPYCSCGKDDFPPKRHQPSGYGSRQRLGWRLLHTHRHNKQAFPSPLTSLSLSLHPTIAMDQNFNRTQQLHTAIIEVCTEHRFQRARTHTRTHGLCWKGIRIFHLFSLIHFLT